MAWSDRAATTRDCLAITLVWAALVALVRPFGDFAANDDWVYALAVQSILHDGRFALPSPATANLALQAYWGALFCLPFGFSFDALKLSTLVLALPGLLATYGLAREVQAPRPVALVAALTLALNPIYLQLAGTFMTDVPFTALTAVALWLFVRGGRRDDARLIVAAFAVALAAVLLRQFALIVVLAFAVGLVLRTDFAPRAVAATFGALLFGVLLHLGFQHWLIVTGRTPLIVAASVHDVLPVVGFTLVRKLASYTLILLPYFGLMAAPVYAALGFGGARRMIARQPLLIAPVLLLAAAQAAVVLMQHLVMPYWGNILMPWGLGALTLRDTLILGQNLPPVPPGLGLAWAGALAVGIVVATAFAADAVAAAIEAAVTVIRRRPPVEALWIGATLVVMILLYLLMVVMLRIRLGSFDRYLLVAVPPATALAVLAARPVSTGRRFLIPAAALLALFAAFAIPAAHDYFAWQRARLAATDRLERAGIDRGLIDGGYEYNGFHRYRVDYRRSDAHSYWWVDDDRWIVASGPLPGYRIAARFPFRRWMTRDAGEVVILRRLPPRSAR